MNTIIIIKPQPKPLNTKKSIFHAYLIVKNTKICTNRNKTAEDNCLISAVS